MGAKRWSAAENAVLSDIAREKLTLVSQMHRLPGRSYDGAKLQASRLEIALSAGAWTLKEQATLRKIYRNNESIKAAVQRLLPNRGYIAAKAEAKRLGLSASRSGRTGYSWIERAIEALLQDGQRMTVKQLAEATGASVNAVDKLTSKLRGKKFRVGDWTRSSNFAKWAALWELGTEPDAPRPPRRSPAEACRAYRDRQRIRAGQIDPFASLMQQVAA